MVTFDHWFFFDSISIVSTLKVLDRGINNRSAASYDSKSKILTVYCTSFRDPVGEYVAIVAHAMLHGFLELYSCKCLNCKCSIKDPSRLGNTGHGVGFTEALLAIESALNTEIRDGFCCGLSQGIYREMNTSGWIPNQDQLDRWGVDINDPNMSYLDWQHYHRARYEDNEGTMGTRGITGIPGSNVMAINKVGVKGIQVMCCSVM